jgi:hypothetical protein
MTQLLRSILAAWLACLSVVQVFAQTPAPATNFLVTIQPPDGSIMIEQTTNAVFVTITNYTAFTNLTVMGTFGAQTNINFLDNGAAPDAAATNGTFSANLVTPAVTVGTTQT